MIIVLIITTNKGEKLEELEQGNKSVQEYVHEFEETAQQVGILSTGDKVNRLFRGFKLGIQGDLYFRGVTPLHSSWNTVVAEALLVEAAHRARTGAFKSRREQHALIDEKAKSKNGPPSKTDQSDRSSVRRGFKHKNGRTSRDKGNGASSSAAVSPSKASGVKDANSPPHMSEKEKERHFAEGLCLECHESGHIRRNCPKLQKVKSAKKGKPPGVPMYSVAPEVGTSDDLRELAAESGVTGTLSSAYIDVCWDESPASDDGNSMPTLQSVSASNSQSDWYGNLPDELDADSDASTVFYSCKTPSSSDAGDSVAGNCIAYDDTYENQYLPSVRKKGTYGHHLGDAYASHTARVLNRVFCELYPSRDDDDLDISVIRTSDRMYTVSYWEHSQDVKVTYLRDPDSDICGWCFPWLDEVMGNCLDYGDIPEIPLGHALASEVKTVLSKYIDIPGIDAEEWGERERFAATQYTDYVKLRDMYLAFVVLIPNAMLENAYLDLPNWYAQMLRRELRPESFDLDDLEGELESFFSCAAGDC